MHAIAKNSRPRQLIKTQLLRTTDCLRIRAQLTAFENHFFGPDFAWSLESMERWLRSGSLFYVAVCQKAPREDLRIVALASVLLTGSRSCERLLQGEILESQLVPWFLDSPDSPPILYFSSVISDTAEHLLSLYENLFVEVDRYLKANQLRVYKGLSIAIGPAGFDHLGKNGFKRVEGTKYLEQYDFMSIDAASAETEFWSSLLSPSPSVRDGTQEVEPCLHLFKTGRYREIYPFENASSILKRMF